MITQRDARWWHKLNGALRWGLAHDHGLTGMRPLVNEYPKSGGSWLAQMLAEAMDLPFPRNRLPMARRSILHGHYLYGSGMRDVIIVWRDGRDVMVSWYFHRVVGNELANPGLVKATRERLGIKDPPDIATYLPRFIEASMTAPGSPRFSWPRFVADWADRDCGHIKYEDMLADAPGALGRALRALGITQPDANHLARIAETYSFANQAQRRAGTEDTGHYLRKGIAGDWRDKFTPEATEIFDHHAGDALRKLGYE